MSGQTLLISTLQEYSQLSTLSNYINGSTKLQHLFSSANNFTFLAPTNAAFYTWFLNAGGQAQDVVEATLEYHLLNGSFPAASFGDVPQFAPTNLNNRSYENVTLSPSSQRVELATINGTQSVISSNRTTSTISTRDLICLGGLIQIIDTVAIIPTAIVNIVAQASLSYFAAILNRANFLSVNSTGLVQFVDQVTTTPNLTFFVPNSPEALSSFNNISTSLSADQLEALFNYHIVYDYIGYSSEMQNGTLLKTAEGQNLTITKNGTDTYVNSAKITTPDYLVVNGVMHIIDNVLNSTNATIPSFIPRAGSPATTSNTSPTSTPSQSSSHHGLSEGDIAAAVVVPIVVVLGLLAGLFFFLRKRRTKKAAEMSAERQPGEMIGTEAGKELPGTEAGKELPGSEAGKELDATKEPGELEDTRRPTELDTPGTGTAFTSPATGHASPAVGGRWNEGPVELE